MCKQTSSAKAAHAVSGAWLGLGSATHRRADDLAPVRELAWHIAERAPHVLAAASIVNAMANDPEALVGADTLLAHLPPLLTASIGAAALQALATSGLPGLDALLDVASHHNPLVQRTAMFAEDRSVFTFRGGVELGRLAQDWQRHCAAVAIMIGATLDCLPLAKAGSARFGLELADGLARAADGEWPVVQASGGVLLVRMSAVRQQPRWPVSWQAILTVRTEACMVEVVDVSSAGFGFRGSIHAEIGDELLLGFASGIRLGCTLVWHRGIRGGAGFVTQLRTDHPLLSAAKQMSGLQARAR